MLSIKESLKMRNIFTGMAARQVSKTSTAEKVLSQLGKADSRQAGMWSAACVYTAAKQNQLSPQGSAELNEPEAYQDKQTGTF